jgi:tripeptidyl-peptidase I
MRRGNVWSLFLIANVFPSILSSPVQTDYKVKEIHRIPRGWKLIGRPLGEHTIRLKIALKQSNFAELERHLYEISDPDHPRYGRHLSNQEVISLVKPEPRALELVKDWLSVQGVDPHMLGYSTAKDWISTSLPLSKVEKLLNCKYFLHEHSESGERLVRTLEWSIPESLHAHIDTIQPTTSFLRVSPQLSQLRFLDASQTPADYTPPSDPVLSSACNISSVKPDCFGHLYNTHGYTVQSANNNSIAFTNFLGQVPIPSDAVLFAQKYRPDAVNQAGTFQQYSIAGGPVQLGPLSTGQKVISSEANLDLQTILGISNPTPVISYSTGGSPQFIPDLGTPTNTNEPYLAWLEWLFNQSSIPNVISSSYADHEQTVPQDYAIRVCNEFAQLGAMGVSVLFASGDSGVGPGKKCLSNDGKNTTTFIPSFPASCPYVTAVGATHQFEPEVVAYDPPRQRNGTRFNAYASGGGFGNYFAQPAWQSEVVTNYVANLNGSYDGLYNKSGRAYPDIAAQGQNVRYWTAPVEWDHPLQALDQMTNRSLRLSYSTKAKKSPPAEQVRPHLSLAASSL